VVPHGWHALAGTGRSPVRHGAAGALRQARFASSWLRDVRFTGTSLAETEWADATLIGCAVAGVEAFGSQWHRVTLQGGKLDSVNFRDAQLTVVVFGNCTLRDVDFTGGPWASSWTVGRFAGSAII